MNRVPTCTKGWLKTKIFTFGVALHFFVAGNRRHFELNMWVEHSLRMTKRPEMDVAAFKLLVPSRYLWNGLS